MYEYLTKALKSTKCFIYNNEFNPHMNLRRLLVGL